MRILFQGDSITDGGRNRENPKNLAGYTTLAADALGDGHEYFNLGISGNRLIDLLNRYDTDFKAVRPDIVTILIGINDVGSRFGANLYTDSDTFFKQYCQLLTQLRRDMPQVKIVVIEPFLLPAPAMAHWADYLSDLQNAVRKAAIACADAFIPMDGLFVKELIHSPWQDISGDGVHLTDKGNAVLAQYLCAEIERFF